MQYTLVADGRSDRVLVHVINWVLDQRDVTYTPQVAEWLEQRSLRGRCHEAALKYPCDVLFVHRDAEGDELENRCAEIQKALSGYTSNFVCVVPVRMSEAWLLSSKQAIRAAAENPHGGVALEVPGWKRWDRLPDPREILNDLLKTATELPARRLRRFNVQRARYRVAELTVDFSPLRQLPAFRKFEADVEVALDGLAT